MNLENFNKVLAQIEANPSCWNQEDWHCGSSHCFGGWAQILSGKEANLETVRGDAREYLNISAVDANWLFRGTRTLEEIKSFPNLGHGSFDPDGFDRDGFDRLGYNRSGYNRSGYDRSGYNRDGYNRDGCDRDGLDKNNKRKPI